MLRFYTGIAFIFLYACNSTATKNNVEPQIQTLKTQVESNITKIDTALYSQLSYWDSTMERYGTSYIDTFTEGGVKFRFVQLENDSDVNSATLERYTNGHWIERIEFDKENHTGDFDHSKDINRDGYNDITRILRYTSEVYFFDTIKKDFIDSATAELNDGIFLLDSNRNIFCDFQEFKQLCGNISSSLYTFKNNKRYNIFKLKLSNCDDENRIFINKIILNKCLSGDLESLEPIETIRLKKSINLEDYKPIKLANGEESYFDYITYWQDRYKQLLGYK